MEKKKKKSHDGGLEVSVECCDTVMMKSVPQRSWKTVLGWGPCWNGLMLVSGNEVDSLRVATGGGGEDTVRMVTRNKKKTRK